jgi:hypothetical protein
MALAHDNQIARCRGALIAVSEQVLEYQFAALRCGFYSEVKFRLNARQPVL